MKNLLIWMILALTCTTAFADDWGHLKLREKSCTNYQEYMSNVISERRNGRSQGSMRLELLRVHESYNGTKYATKTFNLLDSLTDSVYLLPQEVIDNSDLSDKFLKDSFLLCWLGEQNPPYEWLDE